MGKKGGKGKDKYTDTLVVLLLDETGSMSDIKGEAIAAVNGYFDELRNDRPEKCWGSIVKFDSTGLRRLCEDVPVAEVPRLTHENYKPGAMTPLLDAMGKIINETAEKADGKAVLFVVETDGIENASREFSREGVRRLVEERTASGWQFVFLGADQNAWHQAQNLGMQKGNVHSFVGKDVGRTMRSATVATRNYRGGGSLSTSSFCADFDEEPPPLDPLAAPQPHPNPPDFGTQPPPAGQTRQAGTDSDEFGRSEKSEPVL